MKSIRLRTPLTKEIRERLSAGDGVLLSGIIYTARDIAHQRFFDVIKHGSQIPLPVQDTCIYYTGPTPARAGQAIGSCGPTTSSRVDKFTPAVLKSGVAGFIGKGLRSEEVRKALKKHKAVYFLAIGGAGALISTRVMSASRVLFKELGPEAVYKLEVKDLPLIVGIDTKGNDIYKIKGRK